MFTVVPIIKNLVSTTAIVTITTVCMLMTTACGNRSESAGDVVTLTGIAQLGRVAHADVTVVSLADGSTLGTATTDENGEYSVAMAPTTSPCEVKITGRSDGTTYYLSEAYNEKVYLRPTDELTALLAKADSTLQVAVTPYSHEAAQLVKQTVSDFSSYRPEDVDGFHTNAIKQVAEAHGIKDYTVLTQMPSNPNSGEQNAYSFAIAQFDQYLKTNDIPVTESLDAAKAMWNAFKKDGKYTDIESTGKYSNLIARFEDSTKGFQVAAADLTNNSNVPREMKEFYSTKGSTYIGQPSASPKDFVKAYKDYHQTVAAGNADPCTDPDKAQACPRNSAFDPNKYDEFKADHGGYMEGSGYSGSGKSEYTGYRPGSGYQYIALAATISGSGSTRTITLKKLDGSTPTEISSYSYKVKKYSEHGDRFTKTSEGTTSSNSFTISVASFGRRSTILIEVTPIGYTQVTTTSFYLN
ncbi:MAG: hypothetical protein HY537_09665 [Deltaproteobacteria bacterium]|nr:hypothetical protein [Deltaproteobacteria bacterium]